jgi:hypothetical protein
MVHAVHSSHSHSRALVHCVVPQVPCGIFDDPKLVAEIREACATIRKAMVQINELSANMSAQNFNQVCVCVCVCVCVYVCAR